MVYCKACTHTTPLRVLLTVLPASSLWAVQCIPSSFWLLPPTAAWFQSFDLKGPQMNPGGIKQPQHELMQPLCVLEVQVGDLCAHAAGHQVDACGALMSRFHVEHTQKAQLCCKHCSMNEVPIAIRFLQCPPGGWLLCNAHHRVQRRLMCKPHRL